MGVIHLFKDKNLDSRIKNPLALDIQKSRIKYQKILHNIIKVKYDAFLAHEKAKGLAETNYDYDLLKIS
jgi:hypothetical protein